MQGIPLHRAIQWESNFTSTPSTTGGQSVTANATPHAKGAWSLVVASTAYDSYGFFLLLGASANSNTRTDMMLDIGIGGAGVEVVILPELLCGWRHSGSSMSGGGSHFIPLFIPKGTRVSARLQSLIASDTVTMTMVFKQGTDKAIPIFKGCDNYGLTVATSIGTSHTPGNTGTESTAANIGSTMSKNYAGVTLVVQGTLSVTATTALYYHWELLVNSVVIAEWRTSGTTSEEVGAMMYEVINFPLATGAQLQLRAESSGTAQEFDVGVYCYY